MHEYLLNHQFLTDIYFIEKLTSLTSLHKICSQFIWLKSEINLLFSNFFQSRLIILDLVTEISGKKSGKKINFRIWSKNVDVILPDSISYRKVEFKKILTINVDVLEILVGKNIRGNKKLELRVSIKLFTESEISYFNKSMVKSPRRKIILDDSFCKFSSKGEIKWFVKSFPGIVGCLYIQATITLVDFKHIISIKVDSIFPGP